MAVENTTNIAGLDDTLPLGSDMKSEGDNHLRLIKTVLKHGFSGFPGEVLLAATEAQGGTVNDYVLTVAPAPTAYAANTAVVFRANHANTGAATLKVGALAAKAFVNPEGTPLRANAITATTWVLAVYDGTNFRLIGGGNSQAIYDYANQLAFQAALPAQAGNGGKFLQTDGADASWQFPLPAQAGNAGKVLATDGSATSWQLPIPDQTGNAGKTLMTDGSTASWAFTPPLHGQCRLIFVSTTECRLMPHNGDRLIINGLQYRIPAVGVPITNAGTASLGRYFVFAMDDGAGGVGLELASTGSSSYSIHTDGVTIKTGDPTRTLVGWFGTDNANLIQDNDKVRHVASWFNRRRRSVTENLSGATSSTATIALSNGIFIFNWAGEEVDAELSGYSQLSGSAFYTMEARRGGATPSFVPGVAAGRNGGGPASISRTARGTPAEGTASYQVFGSVSSGTITMANSLTCSSNI